MKRRRIVLIAAGVIVAGAVAVPVGANVWMDRSADGHEFSVADVPPAPVALVLGAGLTPQGTPSPFLAGRLEVARQLYEAGKVKVVLVSGDNRVKSYDEPTAMMNYLVERGIPKKRIVRDFAGRDTYDSCARAKRIFGVEDLIVVTQGYHLPRGLAICRALGLQANGVGDETGRQYAAAWSYGANREKLAAIKAAYDVVTRRDPVLGKKEDAVQTALESATKS